jgi:acyl-CoA synthetase (AMP-forming)/AMP-acid ligase II
MRSFDRVEVIIPDALAVHGKFRTGKTALVCGDRRFTWGEFDARINRVAKYQRIAGVEFRTEFPRNALGKVMKKELREPFWKDA